MALKRKRSSESLVPSDADPVDTLVQHLKRLKINTPAGNCAIHPRLPLTARADDLQTELASHRSAVAHKYETTIANLVSRNGYAVMRPGDSANAQLANHSTPSSASNHFRLFDLPQELQDAVFHFAYPREPRLKIKTKHQWDFDERWERKWRGQPYAMKPCVLRVDGWLVSRHYFLSAARAWMGAQDFSRINVSHGLITSARPGQAGLFFDYATNAWIHGRKGDVEWIRSCRRLKKLEILIDEDEFRGLAEEFAWERLFSPEELDMYLETSGLISLIDLCDLRVVTDERPNCIGGRRSSAEKVRLWDENASNLSSLLQKYAAGGRLVSRKTAEDTRLLYSCSKVSLQPKKPPPALQQSKFSSSIPSSILEPQKLKSKPKTSSILSLGFYQLRGEAELERGKSALKEALLHLSASSAFFEQRNMSVKPEACQKRTQPGDFTEHNGHLQTGIAQLQHLVKLLGDPASHIRHSPSLHYQHSRKRGTPSLLRVSGLAD